MKTYYKVNIRTEHSDLKSDKYNYEVIVEKGFGFAREIASKRSIIICNSVMQGSCYDYYILDSDLNAANVARYDDVENYLLNFKLDKFPIFSRTEAYRVKTLLKSYRKNNVNEQK